MEATAATTLARGHCNKVSATLPRDLSLPHLCRNMLPLPFSELLVLGAKILKLLGVPGKKLGRGLAVANIFVITALAVNSWALGEGATTRKIPAAPGGRERCVRATVYLEG